MACSACKTIVDPSLEIAMLNYNVSVGSINGHSITESLITLPAKPAKGWGVVLPIKGQQQKISGTNSREVAYNARNLYKINGLHVDEKTLWFNLNVQWLERTNSKYHKVPLATLLYLAEPQEVVVHDPHAVKKVSNEWIVTVVDSIKLHLQAENYVWYEFLEILKRFQRYLNPTENPLLGDSKRYIYFTQQLEKAKNNPIYEREAAKVWFLSLNI